MNSLQQKYFHLLITCIYSVSAVSTMPATMGTESPGEKYSNCNSETWRRKWQPIPVFLPGKIHGQRSLAGYSPWGYMTEHVCTRVEGDVLVAIN